MLEKIYHRIIKGGRISNQETLELVKCYSWKELSFYSEKIRIYYFGNRISICTIINAKSGCCDMDCAFCSQSSRSKTDIKIYPLVSSDCIDAALKHAKESKAGRCGIVTSGGRLDSDNIRSLGEYILDKSNNPKICVSLGKLKEKDLQYLKSKGVSRIHHNLETSQNFYSKICSTQSWSSRVETIREAMKEGFEICSGGLFGLGEDWTDRISLAETLRKLNIKNIPINFFTPHKGTRLEDQKLLTPEEALKIIALYRFILPDSTLRICGGRKLILKNMESEIFRAGANGIMTGDYLTTSGSSSEEDLRMIETRGLKVSKDE